MTIDTVTAIVLFKPDGIVVTVIMASNPSLFFALRVHLLYLTLPKIWQDFLNLWRF
jgi:hypothetical protein